MTVVVMSSVTRISDLAERPFDTVALPMNQWQTGDYVVGRITGPDKRLFQIEDAAGRMVTAMRDDCVVGALGRRAATLEAVGSWEHAIDGRMHAMTSAGLFGMATSVSPMIAPLTEITYVGHVSRKAQKCCMRDFACRRAVTRRRIPTVLLVGTSMSAGKTTTGRLIVHELTKMGKRVIGAKLTGAGRFRDVLSFRDAGAVAVFDFVDAGLPSTIVPEKDFRQAIAPLLADIEAVGADVLVAEAGASPMEPYNGAAAIDELGDSIRCTVLCASDPYAVVGVKNAFGLNPDLVAGPAASTSAAVELVQELAGVAALDVMDPACATALGPILRRTLAL